MPNASGGYQPDTKSPSARRADFDLLRRNTALQKQNGDLQNRIDELQTQLDAAIATSAKNYANSAWGYVGGSIQNWAPYSTTANVAWTFSNALTYTTTVGRRYRLGARFRAVGGTAGNCAILLAGSGIGTNETYRVITGNFDELSADAIFVGTGISSSYIGQALTTAVCSIWTNQPVSNFMLEDIGPVTRVP